METPLVSIVVPCYGQAKYLPDALDSIIAQEYENWECIVVDDGSPDETAQVATTYMMRDPRFLLVRQPNRGLSAARNTGIANSKGSYIQFLDADDLIGPRKLALQIQCLLSAHNQLSLSYTDHRYCPEHDPGQTTTRDSFPPPRFHDSRPILDIASRWETELGIPCHSFLFSARFFRDHGIRFDESLVSHEDWDCWMHIFALNPELYLVEGAHAIYRLHASSMCTDKHRQWSGFRRALLKQIKIHRHDPLLRRTLERKLDTMRAIYAIPSFNDRLRRALTEGISHIVRRMPWPIQKRLLRSYPLKSASPHRPPVDRH